MKKQGQIRVTVQETDRLKAITQLSEAIVEVAKALSATPQIAITGCYIEGVKDGVGIKIDTTTDAMETTIERLDVDGWMIDEEQE